MSSGVFSDTKYVDDLGNVYAARINGETINAWNPAGTGVVTRRGRIKLSAGRREFGLSPRTVSGKWQAAPTGYLANGSVRLPVLTKTAFDAIALNDSLAYNGGTFTVTGKTGEKEN